MILLTDIYRHKTVGKPPAGTLVAVRLHYAIQIVQINVVPYLALFMPAWFYKVTVAKSQCTKLPNLFELKLLRRRSQDLSKAI